MARKVLYLLPNSVKGGAEQLTSVMMRHHDPARYRAHAYFFTSGPFADEVRALGVPTHVSARDRAPRLRNLADVSARVLELKRLIQSEGIELVHSVMGYAHLFGGPAARLAGVSELWYQHGPTGPLDWLTGRVPTAQVLVNSRFTAAEHRKFHPWQARPEVVIRPATEEFALAAHEASRPATRGRLGVAPTDVLVSHFGRITEWKGQRLLIEAASRLKSRFPQACFLVVGSPFRSDDAEYARALREQVARAGLGEWVRFLEFCPDPRALMHASDIVVNSSLVPEPFGLTLIEAMMTGRPVIAPRAGGPLETVREGQDGCFFTPGDVDDLAARIGELIADPGARERMGRAARTRAEAEFGVARMMRELEASYDAILARVPGPKSPA